MDLENAQNSYALIRSMIDQTDIEYIEESVVRWLAVLWIRYTQMAQKNKAVPEAIQYARDHVRSASASGGIPAEFNELLPSQNVNLWKSMINLPVAKQLGGRDSHLYMLPEACELPATTTTITATDSTTKPMRPTEQHIDSLNYIDERHKKRLKSIVKFSKNTVKGAPPP